jgi:hypothetical protein
MRSFFNRPYILYQANQRRHPSVRKSVLKSGWPEHFTQSLALLYFTTFSMAYTNMKDSTEKTL